MSSQDPLGLDDLFSPTLQQQLDFIQAHLATEPDRPKAPKPPTGGLFGAAETVRYELAQFREPEVAHRDHLKSIQSLSGIGTSYAVNSVTVGGINPMRLRTITVGVTSIVCY
jgi:hypothetical protein